MLDLVGEGRAVRLNLGDDALWVSPDEAEHQRAILHEALEPEVALR